MLDGTCGRICQRKQKKNVFEYGDGKEIRMIVV